MHAALEKQNITSHKGPRAELYGGVISRQLKTFLKVHTIKEIFGVTLSLGSQGIGLTSLDRIRAQNFN